MELREQDTMKQPCHHTFPVIVLICLVSIAIIPGICSGAIKITGPGTIYPTLENAVAAASSGQTLQLISDTPVTLTPGNITYLSKSLRIQQNITGTQYTIFMNGTIEFNGTSQTYTLIPQGTTKSLVFSYDPTGPATFRNNSLFEITGSSNTFSVSEPHPHLVAGAFTGTGLNLMGTANSLNSWIAETEDAGGNSYVSHLSKVVNLAGTYNSISDAQSCEMNTDGGVGLYVSGSFNGAPGSPTATLNGQDSPPLQIDTGQITSASGGKIYIAPSTNGNAIQDSAFDLTSTHPIYIYNGTTAGTRTSWYFFNSSWSPSGGNRKPTIDASQWTFPFSGNVSLVAGFSNITGQSTSIVSNSSLSLNSATGKSGGILTNDTSSLEFHEISAVVPVGMSIGNNTFTDTSGNTVSAVGSLGYVTIMNFNPYYSVPNENFNSSRTTDWSSITDFAAARNLTFVIEKPATHTLLGNISYNQDINLLAPGIDSGLAVLGNNLAISSSGNSTNFTMTNSALNSAFNKSATIIVYPADFPFNSGTDLNITATTDSGVSTVLYNHGVWVNRAGFVSSSQDIAVISNSSITLPVLHFSRYDFSAAVPIVSFTASPTSGTAPLTVQFNDTSSGFLTSWNWSFGDSDTTNSTRQNPVHTFVSAGTYTVSLTVTNAGGSNTSTVTGYITSTSSGGSGGDGGSGGSSGGSRQNNYGGGRSSGTRSGYEYTVSPGPSAAPHEAGISVTPDKTAPAMPGAGITAPLSGIAVTPAFLPGYVWIIVIIVVVIFAVLAAFFVRRWWIRRQNPALFRKYD
jgi:PKD repeat protein